MKYLGIKSSSSTETFSSGEISVKEINNNQKFFDIFDNWTIEFFINSKISPENNMDLPVFDYKLFYTESSNVSESCIQIYVSDSNKYILQIDNKIAIIDENTMDKLWNHIAIVYAKDCSIIIYVNGIDILGVTVTDSLSLMNYKKFDKFLFTAYKGKNNIYYTKIQVYQSIRYNGPNFTINYPIEEPI